jgi:hypothetical protein
MFGGCRSFKMQIFIFIHIHLKIFTTTDQLTTKFFYQFLNPIQYILHQLLQSYCIP